DYQPYNGNGCYSFGAAFSGPQNLNASSCTRQADGSWTATFDTTQVANGSYTLRGYADYIDSRNSHKGVTVTLGSFSVDNGVTLTNVSDDPDSFSPNGDGYYE